MTSAPAIGFEYRPSRWLPRLLWLLAALALLAIAACGLSWWLKLPLAALAILLVFRAVHRHRASLVQAAGWSGEAGWSLRLADHRDVPATLASFRVLGECILLRLRVTSLGDEVLLLMPDNSDADIRRRLRMRLATVQRGEAMPRV